MQSPQQAYMPPFHLQREGPSESLPDIDTNLNFFIDELCDDYCEKDDNGVYVIKDEFKELIE